MKHNELKFKIVHSNYMALSTVTIRAREEFRDLIFYNYVGFDDYYIWQRLLYEQDLIFEIMDEYLTYYRVHTP